MKHVRHIQTTNERRQVADAEEQGVKIRPSRGRRCPHAYDDFKFARQGRTWKRHRKTKYRPK